MIKLLVSIFLASTICFCETYDEGPLYNADCLILEDENSIICKYEHDRLDEDVSITIKWIDPSGKVSRQRDLILPAGHGSIYDFRYIDGRKKGIWKFEVIEGDIKTETTFNIE